MFSSTGSKLDRSKVFARFVIFNKVVATQCSFEMSLLVLINFEIVNLLCVREMYFISLKKFEFKVTIILTRKYY